MSEVRVDPLAPDDSDQGSVILPCSDVGEAAMSFMEMVDSDDESADNIDVMEYCKFRFFAVFRIIFCSSLSNFLLSAALE